MTRSRILAIVAIIGVLVAVVVVGNQNDWWAPEMVEAQPEPLSTASVTRTSVSDEDSLTGELRYQGEVVFSHRIDPIEVTTTTQVGNGRQAETITTTVFEPGERAVTALPQLGQIIEPGEALYETNSTTVFTAPGEVSAWRTMDAEANGDDVAQLQRFLIDSGFGEGVVDDGVWSSATTTAVSSWQEQTGQDVTAVVELGDLWFIDGPIRIVNVRSTEGVFVQDGDPLFTYTSTDRRIEVQIDELPAGLLEANEFSGRLSTGPTISATLESVRGVDDGFELTFDAELPPDLPQVDGLDVTLTWTVSEIDDALTVPPEALRRTDAGSYIVDVVQGDSVTTTPVEVVGQAGRLVAISGLVEGAEVLVP